MYFTATTTRNRFIRTTKYRITTIATLIDEPPCDNIVTISIVGDDTLRQYADGILLIERKTKSIGSEKDLKLPYDAQIIAAEVIHFQDIGGLACAFSDGQKNENSWLCTRQLTPGWYKSFFSDSDWPAAVATRAFLFEPSIARPNRLLTRLI